MLNCLFEVCMSTVYKDARATMWWHLHFLMLKSRHTMCSLKVQRFVVNTYYPRTHLLTATSIIPLCGKENNAIPYRKEHYEKWPMQKQLSKGTAGWKKTTQQHQQHPFITAKIVVFFVHIAPRFFFLYANSLKGLLRNLNHQLSYD